MFLKTHITKDQRSSLVAPKESQNTYASTWKICIELDRPLEPHFREMQITPTHVFEIYRRFTHNSIQAAIYHRLAKILKFSTTKMHGTQDNQEDFAWVVMWANRQRERSELMLWECGAISHTNYGVSKDFTKETK